MKNLCKKCNHPVLARGLCSTHYNQWWRNNPDRYNLWNIRKREASSRYKYISFHKASGKWELKIHHKGDCHYIGLFENEDQAIKIYNRIAKSFGIKIQPRKEVNKMTKPTKHQVLKFIEDWKVERPIKEMAEELGIRDATVRNWAKDLRDLGVPLQRRTISTRKDLFRAVAKEYKAKHSE